MARLIMRSFVMRAAHLKNEQKINMIRKRRTQHLAWLVILGHKAWETGQWSMNRPVQM